MNREIIKIVNRVVSEEFSGRISNIKNRLFENKGSEMCEACGSGDMYEGECMECGNMYEGNIQELGGMDDGHPRFGKKRLPNKMSIEDIEKLLRGDDDKGENGPAYRGPEGYDDASDSYTDMGDEDEEEGFPEWEKLKKQMDDGGDLEEDVCEECGDTYEIEIDEKLYGNQSRIDRNKNNRIDREDFKMLRKGGMSDEIEIDEKLYGNQNRIDKNKNGRIDGEDFKMLRKEVYELELNDEEVFLFTENEIIDIIENIVLEEKKKSKYVSAQNVLKSSLGKSKKENDDHINNVVKKMKDYLKDMSKGKYEMNPKHFPAGNGELGEMEKMAYKASNAVEEYIENFTAAALENVDYDEIHPNEDWVTDNIVGSSRTGNNPDWGNAVETPNNKKRNEIRKNNLLGKLKKKAYNKAPQPISNDTSGNKVDKASKIMLNLESKENEQVISEITRMKNILTYTQKTQ